MTRFIKPSGFSALGIRAAWPNNGSALSHVSNASLNLGLNDAIFLFFINKVSATTGYFSLGDKWAAANRYAVYLTYANGKVTLLLGDGVGTIAVSATTILSFGRHAYLIFVNRDGNAEFYDNGVLDGTPDISGTAAINQDNGGTVYLVRNEMGHATRDMSQPLLHYEQWFIDPADFPTAADRLTIAKQFRANPYETPALMDTRPNKATEARLIIPFENLDPAALVITDASAYGNDMTIAGGNTVATCVKEFYNV